MSRATLVARPQPPANQAAVQANVVEAPSTEMPDVPTVELLGVTLHAVTQEQCLDAIMGALRNGRGGWVVTPNLDHVRRCRRDRRYASMVRQADLRVADGMPLVWASRLRGTPLPERVAGSDLIFSLSRELGRARMSAYLLGGAPRTADKAATMLGALYPGLRIAGTRCPPMGFEQDPAEVHEIADALQAARPAVVFVGLGSPKQENLIRMLRRRLPQTWWIGVGVSFSFVCGEVRRAPLWMQRWGLEWLHRVIQEPRRLWKRYLLHVLPFVVLLVLDAVLTRSGIRKALTRFAAGGWRQKDDHLAYNGLATVGHDVHTK